MGVNVVFKDVLKHYQSGSVSTLASDHVSFSIESGEFAMIIGASGAGKSTAMNLIGGIDVTDGGTILVGEKTISSFNEEQLQQYRQQDVGFVFQFYNLIPNLTARENVELAAQISRSDADIDLLLEQVGLKNKAGHFPSQMSGGEQQRVAIARALAKQPKLLLCDEPTGALDYVTGKMILELLHETCRREKMTTIIITHNSALTPMADRVIRMRSGQVIENIANENPTPISEIEW